MTQKNAVIYARFSSAGQNEQSIEGQVTACMKYALANGLSVLRTYEDRALTGRTDKRPGFQQMIEDAKGRGFQYVLVYQMDRFARNRYDSAIYKKDLRDAGVRVLSVNEHIDDSAEGAFLEGLLESCAEYFSRNLSRSVLRGMTQNAQKGLYCGGGIPWGYKIQDGHYVLDEPNASAMKWAFEQYAAGVPRKKIADALNARGFIGRRGAQFGRNSFQNAFSCKVYIGTVTWRGIEVEGACPALIDKKTFDLVQQRIQQGRRRPKPAKGEEAPYYLTGKLFCGHCGASMVGKSGTIRTGAVHQYYVCSTRMRKHTCQKSNERKSDLEKLVIDSTLKYVLEPSHLDRIAEGVAAAYQKDFDGQKLAKAEQAVRKYDADIAHLVETLLDIPTAGRQAVYRRIEHLGILKDEAAAEAESLRMVAVKQLTPEDVKVLIKKMCSEDLTDEKFISRLIDTFINAIYLYDDRLLIFYNVQGQRQVTYTEAVDLTEAADASDADPPDAPSGSRSACSGTPGLPENGRPFFMPFPPVFPRLCNRPRDFHGFLLQASCRSVLF